MAPLEKSGVPAELSCSSLVCFPRPRLIEGLGCFLIDPDRSTIGRPAPGVAVRAISAQFSRAGRGNSGDDARYISQGMTSGLAAPLFQQYNTERGLQHGAAAMAPGMDAGSQALDQYLERLRGIGSMGQESSGTSTTKSAPSLGQTLGGLGMMGLGLAGGFPMMGPLGMAGGSGSLLGGLFGSNPFGMNVALNDWGAGTSVSKG